MKNTKTIFILVYIFFGLIPTILLFSSHDVMCKYDMNPLCYIECALPAIIATPFLFINGIKE